MHNFPAGSKGQGSRLSQNGGFHRSGLSSGDSGLNDSSVGGKKRLWGLHFFDKGVKCQALKVIGWVLSWFVFLLPLWVTCCSKNRNNESTSEEEAGSSNNGSRHNFTASPPPLEQTRKVSGVSPVSTRPLEDVHKKPSVQAGIEAEGVSPLSARPLPVSARSPVSARPLEKGSEGVTSSKGQDKVVLDTPPPSLTAGQRAQHRAQEARAGSARAAFAKDSGLTQDEEQELDQLRQKYTQNKSDCVFTTFQNRVAQSLRGVQSGAGVDYSQLLMGLDEDYKEHMRDAKEHISQLVIDHEEKSEKFKDELGKINHTGLTLYKNALKADLAKAKEMVKDHYLSHLKKYYPNSVLERTYLQPLVVGGSHDRKGLSNEKDRDLRDSGYIRAKRIQGLESQFKLEGSKIINAHFDALDAAIEADYEKAVKLFEAREAEAEKQKAEAAKQKSEEEAARLKEQMMVQKQKGDLEGLEKELRDQFPGDIGLLANAERRRDSFRKLDHVNDALTYLNQEQEALMINLGSIKGSLLGDMADGPRKEQAREILDAILEERNAAIDNEYQQTKAMLEEASVPYKIQTITRLVQASFPEEVTESQLEKCARTNFWKYSMSLSKHVESITANYNKKLQEYEKSKSKYLEDSKINEALAKEVQAKIEAHEPKFKAALEKDFENAKAVLKDLCDRREAEKKAKVHALKTRQKILDQKNAREKEVADCLKKLTDQYPAEVGQQTTFQDFVKAEIKYNSSINLDDLLKVARARFSKADENVSAELRLKLKERVPVKVMKQAAHIKRAHYNARIEALKSDYAAAEKLIQAEKDERIKRAKAKEAEVLEAVQNEYRIDPTAAYVHVGIATSISDLSNCTTVQQCQGIQHRLESAHQSAHESMAKLKADKLKEYEDSSEAVKSQIAAYYTFRLQNLQMQKNNKQKLIDAEIEKLKRLSAAPATSEKTLDVNPNAAAKLRADQLMARITAEGNRRKEVVAAASKSSEGIAGDLMKIAEQLHNGEITFEEAQKLQEELTQKKS